MTLFSGENFRNLFITILWLFTFRQRTSFRPLFRGVADSESNVEGNEVRNSCRSRYLGLIIECILPLFCVAYLDILRWRIHRILKLAYSTPHTAHQLWQLLSAKE